MIKAGAIPSIFTALRSGSGLSGKMIFSCLLRQRFSESLWFDTLY